MTQPIKFKTGARLFRLEDDEGAGARRMAGFESKYPCPPWRNSDSDLKRPQLELDEADECMVNAALHLRRPLLLTGPPGSGKSSLAHAVAAQLGLGQVLVWPVGSRSTLREGMYDYDAIARLQDFQLLTEEEKQKRRKREDLGIGDYLSLGPLGTALLGQPGKDQSTLPSALLIDELDKGDIDLPNDLLHVFEEGSYEIPELGRIKGSHEFEIGSAYRDHNSRKTRTVPGGRVVCKTFPFVVITSNRERRFPAPFLRRCLRHRMAKPTAEKLRRILKNWLPDQAAPEKMIDTLIQQFVAKREEGHKLAVDQLLNAAFLVTRGTVDPESESLFESLDEV